VFPLSGFDGLKEQVLKTLEQLVVQGEFELALGGSDFFHQFNSEPCVLKKGRLQVGHQKRPGPGEQVLVALKGRGEVGLVQGALVDQIGHEFFRLLVHQGRVDPGLFGHEFRVELVQSGHELQGNSAGEPNLDELFVMRVHAHQDPIFNRVVLDTNLMDVHGVGFYSWSHSKFDEYQFNTDPGLEFKTGSLN